MGYQPPALGERMHCSGFVLKGTLPSEKWVQLLHDIAGAIGMSAIEKHAIWTYPTTNGSGGNGMTVVLPITESFLALDTWSDHDGAYLFVCSCRPYHTVDVEKAAVKFGLALKQPAQRFYNELSLK